MGDGCEPFAMFGNRGRLASEDSGWPGNGPDLYGLPRERLDGGRHWRSGYPSNQTKQIEAPICFDYVIKRRDLLCFTDLSNQSNYMYGRYFELVGDNKEGRGQKKGLERRIYIYFND